MESRQQLFALLSKAEPARCKYLTSLFQYAPDTVVTEIIYEEAAYSQHILDAGSPSDAVYFLLSGSISGVDYQALGHAYYFMDLANMYVIGDFEVFGDFPDYCVSICAVNQCKLLKLSAKSYLHWIKHDANASFLRLKNLMATLTSERMSDRGYIFMSCKERLADLLIKAYENEKRDSVGIYKMTRTQAELADWIGFNVRSVQRSIAALENEQLISTENGKITISQQQFIQLKQSFKS